MSTVFNTTKGIVMRNYLFILAVFGLSAGSPAGLSAVAWGQDGFFKTKVGEIDFYCVKDAADEIDNAVFAGDPEVVAKMAPKGKTPLDYNTFLVAKGNTAVLIDTGNGGNLLDNLGKTGISPEKIDAVLLSHSHGDHVGGLLKNGERVFPKAVVWIAPKELVFWNKSHPDQVEACRKAYGAFKEIVPDEKTAILLPEITAVDLEGHTPGHTGFMIASQDQKLLVIADLIHSEVIQLPHPEICAKYDQDREKSAEIRRDTLRRAAVERIPVAGSHIPGTGIRNVAVQGDGFIRSGTTVQ